MPDTRREVCITGIGLVSSLGEGLEAHWDALEAGRVVTDAQSFAPYVIHPLTPLDFDKQIPKKGDQRQMEPWQRIGTYAAGLALDDAGIKGNADILSRTDLIVAARGGERDETVDAAILTGLVKSNGSPVFLNERLMNDLRPTLFLAQLSNLLAGNISIVHGVTGSSRTLMGEETAGADAVRIGAARIGAGQSDIVLVGAACNSNRYDQIMHFEFRGLPWKGQPQGVWQRAASGGGLAFGSGGVFLVLEAVDHARARNAKPHARLRAVQTGWTRRNPGAIANMLESRFAAVAPGLEAGASAVISGASGVEPATGEERAFLSRHPEFPVRAVGTQFGHGMETHFPISVAVAAMSVARGKLYDGRDGSTVERPFSGGLRHTLVTGVGHWRGEATAVVEAAD